VSDPTTTRSTFRRARRREAYRRLSELAGRRAPNPLLTLDEVSKRLRAFEQTYVGVRQVRVGDIVGTVSRVNDFDRDFLPKRSKIRERWHSVEQRYPEGDFPPIVVYGLDGRYFIVDGHHRVAIAKQRGIEWIDAEITQLRSRWRLPPDADQAPAVSARDLSLSATRVPAPDSRPSFSVSTANSVSQLSCFRSAAICDSRLPTID